MKSIYLSILTLALLSPLAQAEDTNPDALKTEACRTECERVVSRLGFGRRDRAICENDCKSRANINDGRNTKYVLVVDPRLSLEERENPWQLLLEGAYCNMLLRSDTQIVRQ